MGESEMLGVQGEDLVGDSTTAVGDEDFFGQAIEEAFEPGHHVIRADDPVGQLFFNLMVFDDGTCQQLGEEEDIVQVAEEVPGWFTHAAPGINKIGDFFKDDK